MLKKLFSCLLVLSLININTLTFAACYRNGETPKLTEHIEPVSKKATVNTVEITNYRKIVDESNVLAVTFDNKFFSKKAQAGDVVCFTISQALYTCEGTMVLPRGTKFIAEVTNIQNPKWFNKNARVSLIFNQIQLPNGRCIPIKAMPFTKDGKLKEGPWMTAGSILLSTVTLGIIGGGAGVGFGFIPNPAKVGVGIGAGIAIGCGVGLLSALITKGLHYKAKCGEQILIILCDDVSLENSKCD